MSDIRPFRALRPRPEVAERVAAPPYDVVNTEEARQIAAGNPLCFLHVSRPEINLPPDVDLYDDRVYAQGPVTFQRMISEGVFLREQQPRLYLYQQKMGTHVQTGVVCAASCAEYAAELIKRHEYTRPDKEDDRTRHTRELNANSGPVFLTYHQHDGIDALVEQIRNSESTVYDFVAPDRIGHTVWIVPPALTGRLSELFKTVPALYVADGHHRAASAARVGLERKAANPQHTGDEPYNYFLAVLFPHDQLRIMDYNRVVKDLNGLSAEEFLSRLGKRFSFAPTTDPRPVAPRHFSMFFNGSWYGLQPHAGTWPVDDPVRSLDVAILQENLLAPVLGIADPRTDKRIDFVGGIRGLGELEKRVRGGWAAAFALYPTSLEQLMDVADAGLVMPPKSTWFEPKLRSGLLVRTLDSW
jgi:uncharacterized protein (DUF1015 family)